MPACPSLPPSPTMHTRRSAGRGGKQASSGRGMLSCHRQLCGPELAWLAARMRKAGLQSGLAQIRTRSAHQRPAVILQKPQTSARQAASAPAHRHFPPEEGQQHREEHQAHGVKGGPVCEQRRSGGGIKCCSQQFTRWSHGLQGGPVCREAARQDGGCWSRSHGASTAERRRPAASQASLSCSSA